MDMEGFLKRHPDMKVYWETLAAVGAVTGSPALVDLALESKGDEVVMWKSIEGLMERGYKEGAEKMLIQLVCRKYRKGWSAENIADMLEVDVDHVKRICDAAADFAPDYDCAEIYNRLYPVNK